MGKKSRDKGANFERWICKQIDSELGFNVKVKRNLSQYQTKGQSDIIIPGFAIECKAYAKGYTHKADWWVQACEQAGDLEPVLVYKYDYQEPRAVISLSVISKDYDYTDMVCTISLPDLWYIIREKLSEKGLGEVENI